MTIKAGGMTRTLPCVTKASETRSSSNVLSASTMWSEQQRTNKHSVSGHQKKRLVMVSIESGDSGGPCGEAFFRAHRAKLRRLPTRLLSGPYGEAQREQRSEPDPCEAVRLDACSDLATSQVASLRETVA